MIIASDISLQLGDKIIFDDISFNFLHNQRIGLIGRNGTGKSTLLKVLAGMQGLDSGVVSIEKKRTIAYLPQEVVLQSDKTVRDETASVFHEIISWQERVTELERMLAQQDKDMHKNDREQECSHERAQTYMQEYTDLQEKLAHVNLSQKLAQVEKVLRGLGFSNLDAPVSTLSVGWKMRILLAKLLLQDADFYLFDEPTNHLDIIAKDWFCDFLKKSQTGFLLVSHDKYFLDNLCKHIFELDNGRGKLYNGNYSSFEKQKEKDLELKKAAYEQQQKEIKKKRDLIERFRAKATKAKMAQSLIKSLEKIEIIKLDHGQKNINFNFTGLQRTGKIVLTVKNLSKKFDNREIFKNISFEIKRGDKVALIAPNGKGKTTLINLIAGDYVCESGEITFGHNVEYARFEQDQDRLLDPKKEIIEEVESVCKTSEDRARVRSLLGAFLFPGDDVHKKIGILSGGEKNRVAMVKVLIANANFLILDEPTNHLDLQSKEILLSALRQFTGTILFVSHDRYFLENLATRILDLQPDGIISHDGHYESYVYQKNKQEQEIEPKYEHSQGQKKSGKAFEQACDRANKQTREPSNALTSGKQAYEQQKKVKKLENKINKLEKELKAIHKKFETLTYGSQDFDDNNTRLREVKKALKSAYRDWEQHEDT